MTRRPAWYADQQAAIRDVMRGRRSVLEVALELLVNGCRVGIGDVVQDDRPMTDGAIDYARELDLEANGVRVEVKGRALRFTSPTDYPHPTIFVGSEVQWRRKRAAGNVPAAVVVVSEVTGAKLVIPATTFAEWRVEDGRDTITGETVPSYAAPKSCARDFDELLELVTNDRRSLMHDNGGPPRIVRRRHGTGHVYTLNGAKAPGATTVIGNGYPKHLEKWAADQSAGYAIDHWDELAEMKPSERLKLIAGARFADRDAAARRGTEVHRLARRIIGGEEVPVPDELEGHVDAYLAFLDDWQPAELLVETPVANVTLGYCGTLDMIADLVDGHRWLVDLKTTRSGVYLESALQLSAYRNAEWYLDGNGEPQRMLEVERCGVVWLRGDRTYELVPVNASPATFRVFLAARVIGRYIERNDALGEALEAPVRAPTDEEVAELAELEFGPPLPEGA